MKTGSPAEPSKSVPVNPVKYPDQSQKDRKLRAKRFDNGCCTRCGVPMPGDDLRTKCVECRRYGVIYDTYKRQFLADFS